MLGIRTPPVIKAIAALTADTNNLPADRDTTGQVIEGMTSILKFIFSWVILTPISIIISGKLLAQRMKLGPGSKSLFKISLFGMLTVEATNDEVILGFTGFIITLCIVGFAGGSRAYTFFREHFGLDPGHFNALCVLSAFLLVVWTFILFLITLLMRLKSPGAEALAEKHSEMIKEIAERQNPS
jgi:hypothetical protein